MKNIAHFLRRANVKLCQMWFSWLHAPYLAKCAPNTHIFTPFRIDGGENIQLGDGTVMQSGSWLYCKPLDGKTAHLIIGSGCVFGYNNHITSVSDVVIEDKVLTANNVYISDNLHSYEDINVPIIDQPVRFKRGVRIGFGSWIGENVSIIGANIGKNCVIGSNSVVTRDIPDYSVAAGTPAEIIKQFDHQHQAWVTIKRK